MEFPVVGFQLDPLTLLPSLWLCHAIISGVTNHFINFTPFMQLCHALQDRPSFAEILTVLKDKGM